MARLNFTDRVPAFPGRYQITHTDGTTEKVTAVRDDEATTPGTKLKADILNMLSQFEDFSPADFLIDPETKQITLKNAGGGASELDVYRNSAMLWRINNNLDVVIIHFFDNASDIDSTFFDGAEVISDCLDLTKNIINKTSSGALSICTQAFPITGNIVRAGYSVDGTGDISASISLDNGSSWTELSSSEITSIISTDASARLKITMTGECVIKNMCWGVEFK